MLSPFNPIHFYGAGDITGGRDYVQDFASGDLIMLQVIHKTFESPGNIEIYDYDSGKKISDLRWKSYRINDTDVCSIIELTGLREGMYLFSYGGNESNPVRIRSDDDLEDTVLVQYANKDNKGRTDMISAFFGALRYFELRLSGGFKDSGWIFKVENDQFVSQQGDLVELGSIDYTDKILTIGTSSGVPEWIPELINRILTCPLVFVDGIRYSRSCDSAVEASEESDVSDKNVYTVLLREAHYLDPEMERRIRLLLRRTPQTLRGANGQFRKLL